MSFLALGAVVVANAQTTATPAKKHASQTKNTPAAPSVPDLEPKAIEILKATSARLAAAHTLSFTAVEIFEYPSRHGHPLAYATKSDVTLQRPDKLRVIIAGDGPASEFYYDGKIMMAYAPAENLLAVADAPSTIDATLETAYTSAGIYFPFTDLIVADPYKDMQGGLMLAYYVATSNAYNAGVATGSANTAAATTNAYNAGVATGAAAAVTPANFPVGAIVAAPPAGSISTNVQGQTFYLNGNTWFQPAYGANGVYYRVVPGP